MVCQMIAFICSTLILLFLLLHDWVNLAPFNDLKALDQNCSFKDKVLMTVINVPFFVIYLAILIAYRSKPFSFHARLYLIVCNVLFLLGIIFSWWIPYFFAWPKKQVQELKEMYQSTHSFLPKIGSNPIPDTMHVIFHFVFLINMIATFLIL